MKVGILQQRAKIFILISLYWKLGKMLLQFQQAFLPVVFTYSLSIFYIWINKIIKNQLTKKMVNILMSAS
ncbi:hypothetical protein X975_18810, partial [Stegodyphus mimosarum]